MASMSMTASLLPNSTASLIRLPSTTARRGLIVAKASSRGADHGNGNGGDKAIWENSNANGRRELVFAAVAAACSVANIAMGEEEPNRGTPEAKKKYAPICVTMPTARVCRK